MTTDDHTAVRYLDDVAVRSLLAATRAPDVDMVIRLNMGSSWSPARAGRLIGRAPAAPPVTLVPPPVADAPVSRPHSHRAAA